MTERIKNKLTGFTFNPLHGDSNNSISNLVNVSAWIGKKNESKTCFHRHDAIDGTVWPVNLLMHAYVLTDH